MTVLVRGIDVTWPLLVLSVLSIVGACLLAWASGVKFGWRLRRHGRRHQCSTAVWDIAWKKADGTLEAICRECGCALDSYGEGVRDSKARVASMLTDSPTKCGKPGPSSQFTCRSPPHEGMCFDFDWCPASPTGSKGGGSQP